MVKLQGAGGNQMHKFQNKINVSLYIFIISQLWLTSHPRNAVVLLDTITPGTNRASYSGDADDETRTRNPSAING